MNAELQMLLRQQEGRALQSFNPTPIAIVRAPMISKLAPTDDRLDCSWYFGPAGAKLDEEGEQ